MGTGHRVLAEGRGQGCTALPLAHQRGGLERCCVSPGRAHPHQLEQSSPGQDPPSVLCSSHHQYLWVLAWRHFLCVPAVPQFPNLFQLGSLPDLTLLPLGVHLETPGSLHLLFRALVQPLAELKPSRGKWTHSKLTPSKKLPSDPWKTPCTGMEQWWLRPELLGCCKCSHFTTTHGRRCQANTKMYKPAVPWHGHRA